jgi:hypothetical protein
MFGSVLVVVVLVYYLFKFYSRRNNLPPGPFPLPIVGNIYQLDFKAPHNTLDAWGKKYGGIFTADISHQMVVITDIDLIREALVKNGLKQFYIFCSKHSFLQRMHFPVVRITSHFSYFRLEITVSLLRTYYFISRFRNATLQ